MTDKINVAALRALAAKTTCLPMTSKEGPDYAELIGADGSKVALTMQSDLLLTVNALPALLEAAEAKAGLEGEVARLREALRPFAAMRTIAEVLRDPESPAWVNASPSRRIEMMGESKREHDAAILAARDALSENPQ